jgi:hypothetical protein
MPSIGNELNSSDTFVARPKPSGRVFERKVMPSLAMRPLTEPLP